MRLALVLSIGLAPALAAAAPIPASDLLIRRSSPQLGWRWRAAPEAATQPALLKALRTEAQQDAAKASRGAARDAASAAKAGFPFRPHAYMTDWSLAAYTPHLLVLVSEATAYTGGAHGNTGYAARLWDKQARRAIKIDALFSDWPRARKLLEPDFCKALAAEQARRLAGNPPGELNACPKLSEQPIVPFAGLSSTAWQYRVLLAPYVAGTYAEGSYKIDMSWPDGIKALVKPQYRSDLFGDAR